MALAANEISVDRGKELPSTHKWMVLWTKARQEKAVGRFLGAMGTSFYLPLLTKKVVVNRRKLTSSVPLFPGYVFLQGKLEDAYAAMSTKRVCQLIPVPNQDEFIKEMGQIRRALEGDGVLKLHAFAVEGRRCRVASGPFMGIEGVITDRFGPDRLVLQVGILGQGASLEIDIDLLEPLD